MFDSSSDLNDAYPKIINQYPKSSLGYKTNNLYQTFPPLMNDSRSVISSWNAETSLNDKIKSENGIRTNWEYRKFLTKNATEIMRDNFNETANDTGSSFISPYKMSNNFHPQLLNSINDKTDEISNYQTSDLKEMYLSREQLYSRKFVPTFEMNGKN